MKFEMAIINIEGIKRKRGTTLNCLKIFSHFLVDKLNLSTQLLSQVQLANEFFGQFGELTLQVQTGKNMSLKATMFYFVKPILNVCITLMSSSA